MPPRLDEDDDDDAEDWVELVVDIVYELEDLLEDDDGYGGDRDEGESKSSRSFREDAARLERRAAAAFAAGDDSEFSHEHAALHDEFRELVEARVEATLGERRFTPSQFVARLKAVEDRPDWAWARETTARVAALLREADDFRAWARAMRRKSAGHHK
ncbi:hypothetical protein SO694_00083169 [Aureococcus anophagefferens]|uniref:BART domain-containing protein n=1 Tax=Aureococcus anophagefferens TaxID=44056 RepID=A0ABR1FJE2_AURAN